MSTQEEYNDHMDALALRIGSAVDGEDKADIVFACTAVIAYALRTLPEADRKDLMAKANDMLDLINSTLDAVERKVN